MQERSGMDIILRHMRRYPQMQPQDMAKLLYQRRMGPGHFIPDADAARARLLAEWEGLECSSLAAFEDIGGGFCRLHLSALSRKELPRLLTAFLSASRHTGSFSALRRDLRELTEALPQTAGYIAEYIRAGCPAVSHSESYRRAYRPAYRVIRTEDALRLFRFARDERQL